MELIRNWILTVTAASMIIALAEAVMPEGTVKKIGTFTGGLVIMVGILQPLLGLDYEALSTMAAEVNGTVAEVQEESEQAGTEYWERIIEERTAAYILDKAAAIGTVTDVSVSCETGEDGMPAPASVRITGTLSEQQQAQLEAMIETDLGIPAQRQTYLREETS